MEKRSRNAMYLSSSISTREREVAAVDFDGVASLTGTEGCAVSLTKKSMSR